MTDLSDTVDTYLSADGTKLIRTAEAGIIQSVWASDGRLIDPPLAAAGQDEISNMVAALQSQFPEHHFVRTSGIDEHHDHFRFAWDLVAADDSTALEMALTMGELADDGTISRITWLLW